MDDNCSSSGATGCAGVVSSQFKGVAPGATVEAFKWDNNLAEHEEAADLGAVLSQNSWGYGSIVGCTPYGEYQWDAPEYDQIVRGYLGATTLATEFLVNFAAGNDQDNSSCDMPGFPGYMTIGPPATNKNTATQARIE